MKVMTGRSYWFVVALLALALHSFPFSSQAQTKPEETEDALNPADFTAILKEAWTYLRDETKNSLDTTKQKSEFETSADFTKRVATTKQQYLTSLFNYSKEKKFDQRIFGVLLKAQLVSYDADNQVYKVGCSTTVEAPYNIPTVQTEVSSNPYVALADSITRGYRTSSIYLKFNPYFRWQVSRDVAVKAKADEANLYFKVRFAVNFVQSDITNMARFTIIPKHIQLINQQSHTVYWDQSLR